MRICIAYDCLYPFTVGGAERWYRGLAAELAAAGHSVTYLTRRQWPRGEEPQIEGLRVLAVSRPDELYGDDGNRRVGPPLRFGWGVFRHLLGNRNAYDAVHLCSFPYFSLLGARAALLGSGVRLEVDWFEVWSRGYWLDYLGPVGGRIGHLVQRLCARVTPTAFTFSDLHARRLRDEGLRVEPIRLAGLYAGAPVAAARAGERAPLLVFAGRHIAEKRPELIPTAVAAAREHVPGLRGLILGDGPRRPAVLEAIAAAGAEEYVSAPGFVESREVGEALARASCHVMPSRREGYGLVVIEAAARGTPTVAVAGDDNAATELIEDGVNGMVAAHPDALADAIVAVHRAGAELRDSTRRWFEANAEELSVRSSARLIERLLSRDPGSRGGPGRPDAATA